MFRRFITNKALFTALGTMAILLIVTAAGIMYDGFTVGNFRSYSAAHKHATINTTGLEKLNFSGSKICRLNALKQRLGDQAGSLYVLDTLGDDHGFINGFPDIFLGYNKNQESFTLSHLAKYSLRRLLITGTTQREFSQRVSEKTECEHHHLHYIPLKYNKSGQMVFQDLLNLVELTSALPDNAWIHVHCSNGKGRTSVVMIALDILKNAPNVSLEDIVQRQKAIGGEDIFDLTVWENGTYTAQDLENRKQIITDFYSYVVANQDKVKKTTATEPSQYAWLQK